VEREAGGRDRQERRRVQQQARAGHPGGGEHAAEDRPGGHAEIPRGLDVPVGLGDPLLARGRRDERELSRRADGDPGAEQHAQCEQRRQRSGRERHPGDRRRLRE
jgi:hypothetical protein